MWCKNCQADVAGEVSSDARSLLCTTCGGEVSSIRAPGPLPGTRGARELLERWNTEEALDPFQPRSRKSPLDEDDRQAVSPAGSAGETGTVFDQIASRTQPGSSRRPAPAEQQDAAEPDRPQRESRVARRPSRRTFRVDSGHASGEEQPAHAPHPPRDVYASHGSRLDGSHPAPAPHFDIEAAFDQRRKPGRGESLWGQLLAYAGVGILTVGTGLVVWGYFGGPDSYTPTGWLLATAGQMLLFLGVVTLISGGMEQTTHEVTQRIERLGDHIIRIERHTSEHALRGPHYDTAGTADQATPKRSSAASS
jgi:hypothetical protein